MPQKSDRQTLPNGVYEKLVDNETLEAIQSLPEDVEHETQEVDEAERPLVLTRHLTEAIEGRLSELKKKPDEQKALVHQILGVLENADSDSELESYGLPETPIPENLLSVHPKQNTKPVRPESPLSLSSIFTGSQREPAMMSELRREIASADRIDFLVSFIRWSALRILIPDLEAFCERGGKLRVITTTYMGATEAKAVDRLSELPGCEVRVSYDTDITRLHAKAYFFYRNSGYSTVYIGSSNLSKAALTEGLEWNMKITKQDLPDVFGKVTASFDSYWNAKDFEPYDPTVFRQAIKKEEKDEKNPYLFDLRPYTFQQEILDELEARRQNNGEMKNLVVAATGCGKTMIAAFDYRNQIKDGRRPRLLFLAHRKEILEQSLETFRAVLKDPNFGDIYTGDHHTDGFPEHLYMSVQSFGSSGIEKALPADYYDYLVIDEFHHAAASSYQKIFDHFTPKILLGLTATPERHDGKDILSHFDGRISAELRLPEAIDRGLLVPFQYFAVSDGTDLSRLKWSRGGYDISELENVYVLNHQAALRRADLIVQKLREYSSDLDALRGLGFCVSQKHAAFMADCFEKVGIRSLALTSQTDKTTRQQAREDLATGKLQMIFTVDLFNEGVDIPEINTVLFLRPTESLTVFLQQLGRGLRRAPGKECLTVLDFVGQANRHYRFEEKFRAISTGGSVRRQIEDGFTYLPRGCYIGMEKVAQEIILKNVKSATNTRNGLIRKIEDLYESNGKVPSLSEFLQIEGIRPIELYKSGTAFSRLQVLAGAREDFSEPNEEKLGKAMGRIARIDARRFLDFLIDYFSHVNRPFHTYRPVEQRFLRMFWMTLFDRNLDDETDVTADLDPIFNSPVLREELLDLLRFRRRELTGLHQPYTGIENCPLDLHGSYSKNQILVALDDLKAKNLREGVRYLKEIETDVLFVTLQKSEKDYSPSTLYQDYAISENLFHWQSQSTTSAESATGLRYQESKSGKGHILLFVRDRKADAFGTEYYTFLGPVRYVSHEGSRPMSIVWEMEYPIPARLIQMTSAVLAG